MMVHSLVAAMVCHTALEVLFNNNNSNLLAAITDMAINIKVMFMSKVSWVMVSQLLQENIVVAIIVIIVIMLPKP
jgi:hypothetical protein